MTLKNGDVECQTEMLLMKTDDRQADSLIGEAVLSKLGLSSVSPEQKGIVQHGALEILMKSEPKVEPPVEPPKTMQSQVGLLPCYSTFDESNCDQLVNSLTAEDVQQETSVSRDAAVVTIGSVSLLAGDQVRAKSELKRRQQPPQRVPWQKCQTHHVYHKLRRRQRKTMLVEVKRHRKHRGKMKCTGVTMDELQGDDHAAACGKSVPRNVENESVEAPLQFSRAVCSRRANQKKKGRFKAKLQQKSPIHQVTLKRMDKLHVALGMLLGSVTAKQPMQNLLDEDEDENGEKVENGNYGEKHFLILLDEVESRMEEVQRNWQKRKKL
ncbi:MAG: hypothetical protein GY820_47920, partial [Gammaproteobacteria bacterium]|nr:hypothetical protein [Gammaproteobacteria bacterium]